MRIPGVVCAALILVALVGCTPAEDTPASGTAAAGPTDPPAASGTSTAAPTEGPVAPDEPAAIVLPGCEQLLPIETARTFYSDRTEFLREFDRTESAAIMSGPASASAIEGAVQSRGCAWGIPNSDGIFFMTVSEITPESRDALISALVEGGYADLSADGVPQYGLEWTGEVGGDGARHQFVGDVWICWRHVAALGTGDWSNAPVEAIRAANPGIAG